MVLHRALPLVLALLAGCASLPNPVAAPPRSQLQQFSLDARFAVRLSRPQEAPQSANGRLNWTHRSNGDHLELSSPLGQTLAELEITRSGAELRDKQGRTRRAADAASLLNETIGFPLPVDRLPDWLLGQGKPGAQITTDAFLRPSQLREDGWFIDYSYPDDDPDSPAERITVRQADQLELRLRIEQWHTEHD